MLPLTIKPMLAQAAAQAFDSEHYLYEVKWDGIRAMVFIEDDRIRVQSREMLGLTPQFPEFAPFKQLPVHTVLDGEIVILKNGKPSLHHVQRRAPLQAKQRIQQLSRKLPAVFVAFDLLYLRNECLTNRPLLARRDVLRSLLQQFRCPAISFSEAIPCRGSDLFEAVSKFQLEGIMAKHADSPYLPGKRSWHWLKIKCPESRSRC